MSATKKTDTRIGFRMDKESYGKILEKANSCGVSVHEMARNIVMDELLNDSQNAETVKIPEEEIRIVNKELIQIQYYIENLKGNKETKEFVVRSVKNIWHTLN